ncbi:MAG: hypothetical protein HEQ19_01850 [Gloeotrichia echinulata CP02]
MVEGKTEIQLDKLQTVAEKLDGFVTVQNQVQSLIQGSANLEERLTQLVEVQNQAQESITNLVQGKTEIQLEQLQTVAEKLDGFVTVQNQVQSLIQGSANLEERLTQLVEVQNQAQESITNLVQGNTEIQLSQLQAIAEKLDGFVPVQNQVERLIQGTSNLENRLVQFQEGNNIPQQNPTNIELTTNQEKLQALGEKLEGLETVKTQVENLVKGTANLENRLTQLLDANKPRTKSDRRGPSTRP